MCLVFCTKGSGIFRSEKCLSRLYQNLYTTVLTIFYSNLMNYKFSRQIVRVFSKVKLREIPSSWFRVISKKLQKSVATMIAIRQLN